jgi:hypothetical protein
LFTSRLDSATGFENINGTLAIRRREREMRRMLDADLEILAREALGLAGLCATIVALLLLPLFA